MTDHYDPLGPAQQSPTERAAMSAPSDDALPKVNLQPTETNQQSAEAIQATLQAVQQLSQQLIEQKLELN